MIGVKLQCLPEIWKDFPKCRTCIGNLWLGISNIKLKCFCKMFKIVEFMSGCIKWKKPIWKFDSSYKTFRKRQNYPDSKRAVVSRVGPQERGEWIIRAQGIFRAMKMLNDTIMVDTFILLLSRLLKCAAPRVSPDVSCGLWVTLMCQCRFVNTCNKCTLLMRLLIMGWLYIC